MPRGVRELDSHSHSNRKSLACCPGQASRIRITPAMIHSLPRHDDRLFRRGISHRPTLRMSTRSIGPIRDNLSQGQAVGWQITAEATCTRRVWGRMIPLEGRLSRRRCGGPEERDAQAECTLPLTIRCLEDRVDGDEGTGMKGSICRCRLGLGGILLVPGDFLGLEGAGDEEMARFGLEGWVVLEVVGLGAISSNPPGVLSLVGSLRRGVDSRSVRRVVLRDSGLLHYH